MTGVLPARMSGWSVITTVVLTHPDDNDVRSQEYR